MLKWLTSRPKPPEEIVTDDPLATIHVTKEGGPFEIYAVSRVNPIFEDDEDDIRTAADVERRPRVPESPGKSASSGYESNPTDRNSLSSDGTPPASSRRIFIASGGETHAAKAGDIDARARQSQCYADRARSQIVTAIVHQETDNEEKVLRTVLDDALTIVEQNTEYVKSIVVSVRNPKKKSRLAPIPEGKLVAGRSRGADLSIPSPVWPKELEDLSKGSAASLVQKDDRYVDSINVSRGTKTGQDDSILNENLLLYTSFSYDPSQSSEAAEEVTEKVYEHPEEVLRELSATICRSKPVATVNRVLQSDSLRIRSGTSEDDIESSGASVPSRRPNKRYLRGIDAVKDLWEKSGMKINGRKLLVESSSSDDDDSVRNAKQLNSGNGVFSVAVREGVSVDAKVDNIDETGDSTSHERLSTSSSSGFSDLDPSQRTDSRQTDPESKEDHETSTTSSDYVVVDTNLLPPNIPVDRQVCDMNPVFVHENFASVPNSVKNAMMYGTMYRVKGGAYGKLPGSQSGSSAMQQDMWEAYKSGTSSVSKGVQADNMINTLTDRPDFTLDGQKSELLMKQMRAGKRRRCWCRFITSFLGLLVFLLSVMAISLFYTRGQRVFGSI